VAICESCTNLWWTIFFLKKWIAQLSTSIFARLQFGEVHPCNSADRPPPVRSNCLNGSRGFLQIRQTAWLCHPNVFDFLCRWKGNYLFHPYDRKCIYTVYSGHSNFIQYFNFPGPIDCHSFMFLKYLNGYAVIATLIFHAGFVQPLQHCHFDGLTGVCEAADRCDTYTVGDAGCPSNVCSPCLSVILLICCRRFVVRL